MKVLSRQFLSFLPKTQTLTQCDGNTADLKRVRQQLLATFSEKTQCWRLTCPPLLPNCHKQLLHLLVFKVLESPHQLTSLESHSCCPPRSARLTPSGQFHSTNLQHQSNAGSNTWQCRQLWPSWSSTSTQHRTIVTIENSVIWRNVNITLGNHQQSSPFAIIKSCQSSFFHFILHLLTRLLSFKSNINRSYSYPLLLIGQRNHSQAQLLLTRTKPNYYIITNRSKVLWQLVTTISFFVYLIQWASILFDEILKKANLLCCSSDLRNDQNLCCQQMTVWRRTYNWK